MRNTCHVISGLMLIFLFLAGSASALELSPEKTAGTLSQSLIVPFTLSDVGGGLDIDAFSFTIRFDENVLTFDESDGIDKTGTLTEGFSLVTGKNMSPGVVKIGGAMFGDPVHISDSGTFVKVKFVANGAGTSALSLSDFVDDIETAITTDAECTVSPLDPLLPPTNLEARAGIDSVKLTWEPSSTAYLVGCNVYRSESENGDYTQINSEAAPGDYYIDDADLTEGTTYYYYLTTVDSLGEESEPSEKTSVLFGKVKFFIPDSNGKSGGQVRLPVNIANADGLEMCASEIYVEYDSNILSATAVEKTPLSAGYWWDSNIEEPGIVRAGIMSGVGGKTLYGEGSLFYILFDVKGSSGDTSELTFNISSTGFFHCDDLDNAVTLDLSDIGVFTVSEDGGFVLGDLNGDAKVDNLDIPIALSISVGNTEPTEKQLEAGDVNGDGRIRINDAALIERIWKGLPLFPEETETKRTARSSTVRLSIPDNAVLPFGNSAWIPIDIDDAENLTGADIILNYDPSFITASGVRTTWLTDNFDAEFNTDQKGQLRISLTAREGEEGLTNISGPLIEMQFTAPSDALENFVSPLTLASVHLNDTYSRDFRTSALQVDVGTANGRLKVRDLSLGDAIAALKVIAGMSGDFAYIEVTGDRKMGLPEVIHILQTLADN